MSVALTKRLRVTRSYGMQNTVYQTIHANFGRRTGASELDWAGSKTATVVAIAVGGVVVVSTLL